MTNKRSPLAPEGGFPKLPVVDGVRFASIGTGMKYTGRDDVMLAVFSPGTSVAGVFTQSRTRSAAVDDCVGKIGGPSNAGAAFLVNAGNANAFTGGNGVKAVNVLTAQVAETMEIPEYRVFTASTGVIGETLDHDKISGRLIDLHSGLAATNAEPAARAIMTTDTFPKGSGTQVSLDTGIVQFVGFAKGSGMIAPDMATMLSFIFTDATISQTLLQDMVTQAADETFNCITVDSDTSTSDTLLVAATGKSTAIEITSTDSPDGQAFFNALRDVMLDLAHQVVRDGEGATKFISIRVTNATTSEDAKMIANSVANSPLVKTAMAGEDPNWGRIVMAVGKSGATADRDRLSILFGDILVAENGWVSEEYSEEAAVEYMKNQKIEVTIDLGLGKSNATVWTCDLTHGYIEINADYRS